MALPMRVIAPSKACAGKGYRAWGADIGPDHTPFMAVLAGAVKLKSGQPFLGREALVEQSGKPLPRLLAGFRLTMLRSSSSAERRSIATASASAGSRPAAGATPSMPILGYGYVRRAEGVDADFVLSGDYELEVATERVKAGVFLAPPYDPAMARIKGEARHGRRALHVSGS